MKQNPFDPVADPDRHFIWHRQIIVDSEAFVAGDWSMIVDDFEADSFEGIRCQNSTNPDDWQIAFPMLNDYRDSWLAASREFVGKPFTQHTPLEAILARTHLNRIDIVGNRAIAHKQFYGEIPLAGGDFFTGRRQTIYRLHKRGNSWKIVGFLGHLPLVSP